MQKMTHFWKKKYPQNGIEYIYFGGRFIYEGTNLKTNEYHFKLKIFRYNFIYHVQPLPKVQLPIPYENTLIKGDIYFYFNEKT